jgi:hypothetical protein
MVPTVPVHFKVVVIQFPVPCVLTPVGRRRPKVGVLALVIERTIVVAVTNKQSRKARISALHKRMISCSSRATNIV